MTRLLVTRQEAAEALAVCVRTIDTLILTKELRAVNIGRSVRIAFSELERFIKHSHPIVAYSEG